MSIGLCDDDDRNDLNGLSEFGTSQQQIDPPEMREANALIMLRKAFAMGVFDDNNIVARPFVITTTPGDSNTIPAGIRLETLLSILIKKYNSDEIVAMEVHSDSESAETFRREMSALLEKYMPPSKRATRRAYRISEVPGEVDPKLQVVHTCVLQEMDDLLSTTSTPLPKFVASEDFAITP